LNGSTTHASSTIAVPQSRPATRSLAPVFVLGCVRSGTTLLYHMLLSAGNFAVYRTESVVFSLLEPRFGDLSVEQNKRRLLNAWCDSRLFSATGLERESISEKVLKECSNGGDFLRLVMTEIAAKQGVQRWADTTPEHLLHLHRIKETIPDALVIHIIRDGRDVALSTDKQGYIRRLPWDSLPSKMAAGMYWEWMVSKGRRDGRDLGGDYIEVHFEDLVREPRQTLARLGCFIGQDLDYDKILQSGIGSVSAPNSSFGATTDFNPVGRWNAGFSHEELLIFESLVGHTLEENGYEPAVQNRDRVHRPGLQLLRASYKAYFDAKLYLKSKTRLGRMLVTRDLSWV
jgi:hypothetical protein